MKKHTIVLLSALEPRGEFQPVDTIRRWKDLRRHRDSDGKALLVRFLKVCWDGGGGIGLRIT